MVTSFSKIKKNIIIYFILFGFSFGLINTIDHTGGDLSYSMLLNVPTLYALRLKDNLFNSIERARFNKASEEIRVSPQPPTLLRDEFEKLSPEKQEEFVSQMTRQNAIRGFISFPILSAITWGFLGFVVYLVSFVIRKYRLEPEK